METLTKPTPPSDPPAARHRWVLLETNVNNRDNDPSVPDAKTTAASCTSTGQSFSVSFALAAPPASTMYFCDWIGGAPSDDDDPDEQRERRNRTGRDESKNLHIVAAHDDCALIQMRFPERRGSRYHNKCEHFMYEAGAGRTPWLSLLPDCFVSRWFQRGRDGADRHIPSRINKPRLLDVTNTAVLRLVDGELLVGELEVILEKDRPIDTAELCTLRPAGHGESRDWQINRLSIAHHEGGKLPECRCMDAAFAVGVRFMCWVDYNYGFFFHDVAADEACSNSTKLLYVPLPVPEPEEHRHYDRPCMSYRRNLGAAGLNAVRFVSVAPRCCCGGHGQTLCERSRFAFNVTTWTLTLKKEGPMTWVKDGVLDCDDLWQHPNYGCLPRVVAQYPIVSSDNPDIICFLVCENHFSIENADKTVWLLEVDTKIKALLSVVRHGTGGYYGDSRLPAKLRW